MEILVFILIAGLIGVSIWLWLELRKADQKAEYAHSRAESLVVRCEILKSELAEAEEDAANENDQLVDRIEKSEAAHEATKSELAQARTDLRSTRGQLTRVRNQIEAAK